MARYIDADALKRKLIDEKGFFPAIVAKALEEMPDADVVPKSEWISVEERLPENYGSVLVACEGTTIGGTAPIAIRSYGGGFWSLVDADGTAYLTEYMHAVVTHWMPLPEPPKMKGGAK